VKKELLTSIAAAALLLGGQAYAQQSEAGEGSGSNADNGSASESGAGDQGSNNANDNDGNDQDDIKTPATIRTTTLSTMIRLITQTIPITRIMLIIQTTLSMTQATMT